MLMKRSKRPYLVCDGRKLHECAGSEEKTVVADVCYLIAVSCDARLPQVTEPELLMNGSCIVLANRGRPFMQQNLCRTVNPT